MSSNHFSSTLIGSDLLIPALDDDDEDDSLYISSIISQRRVAERQSESQRERYSQLRAECDATLHDTTLLDFDFDEDLSNSSGSSQKSFAEELEERAQIEREFNAEYAELTQSQGNSQMSLEGRQVLSQLNHNSRSPTPEIALPSLTQDQLDECNIASFLRANAARERKLLKKKKSNEVILTQIPKNHVRNLDSNGYDSDDSLTLSQQEDVERMLQSIADEPFERPIIEFLVLPDPVSPSMPEIPEIDLTADDDKPQNQSVEPTNPGVIAPVEKVDSDGWLDTQAQEDIKKLEREFMANEELRFIADEPFDQPVIRQFALLPDTRISQSPERPTNEAPVETEGWLDTQAEMDIRKLEEEYAHEKQEEMETSIAAAIEANQDPLMIIPSVEKFESNDHSQEIRENLRQLERDYLTTNKEISPETPTFPLSQLQLSIEEQQEVDRLLASVENEPADLWDEKPAAPMEPEQNPEPSVIATSLAEVHSLVNQIRTVKKQKSASQPVHFIKNQHTPVNSRLNRRLNKIARRPLTRMPAESDADYEYRTNHRMSFLENYNFSQVDPCELDFSLIAPKGSVKSQEIPKDAPKKFVSAKTFMEMSQSQKFVPLSENIEKDDIVISMEREHDFVHENNEENFDDEAMEGEHAEDSAETLNESLQELSDRINLNISLTSLSQKLNTSDVLENCVKNKKKVEMSTQECEEMFLNEIKTQPDAPKTQTQRPSLIYRKEDMAAEKMTEMALAAFNECILSQSKYQGPSKAANPPQMSFGGFQMASGKKLSISETSAANASKKFSQSPAPGVSGFSYAASVAESAKKKFEDTLTSGFKMASGKKLTISDTSVENASKKFSQSPAPSGFSFLSGRNVQMSTEAAESAKKQFQDTPKSSNSGFKMASGKRLQMSTEAAENASKKFSQSPVASGFSSASGKNLQVSASTAESAKKSFGGFMMASGKNLSVSDDSLKDASKKFSQSPAPSGFSSASGKNLQVSAANAENAKKKFEDTPVPQKSFGGFSLAGSGKSIQVSDKAAQMMRQKFNESSQDPISCKPSTSGYKPAESSPNDLMMRRKQLFTTDDSDSDEDQPMIKKPVTKSFGGFGFASGKALKISDTTAASAKRKFSDLDVSNDSGATPKRAKVCDTSSTKISQNSSSSSAKISQSFSSFRQGNRAKQPKDDLFDFGDSSTPLRSGKRSRATEDDLFDFSTANSTNDSISSSSTPASKKVRTFDDPFTMASKPKTAVEKIVNTPNPASPSVPVKSSVAPPMSPFAPLHASSPVIDFKRTRSALCPSRLYPKKSPPNKKAKSPVQSPSASPKASTSKAQSPLHRMTAPDPGKILQQGPIMTRYADGAKVVHQWPEKMPPELMVVAKTYSQEERQWDILMNLDRYIHPDEIKAVRDFEKECLIKFALRDEKMKEQREYIKNKPHADTLPIRGAWYLMKEHEVKQDLPAPTIYEFDRRDIPSYSSTDLKTFKEMSFNVRELIPEGDPEVSITLGDNVEVVIGDLEHVEYENLKLAFLSAPGVDPKLLHEKWLENAYTMAAIKLFLKEKKSESEEKFLTAENLLFELKYRYDREIDLSELSAIRSITELDGQPQGRMVLMVHEIHHLLDVGVELELSDGWYKIRTKVDKEMANAIDRGAVAKFSKLVISYATYHNSSNQPFHPFDMPMCNKLEIFTNSTRLISDDAKLGFCEDKLPFYVRLDTVDSQCGIVAKLKLFVVHSYGVIYRVINTGEQKGKTWRSERVHTRFSMKNEIQRQNEFEKLYNETLDDYRAGLKESAKETAKKIKKGKVEEIPINDLAEFLDYEQEETDERLEVLRNMTKLQNDLYEKHRIEMSEKFRKSTLDEISKSAQIVSTVLRFRVVDLEMPERTALVNFYDPNEEIIAMVKEGRMVELAGAMCYTSHTEINLYAKNVHCSEIKNFAPDFDIFSQFYRQESKFPEIKELQSDELYHKEVDITCMVVHIAQKDPEVSYQPIYVVDEHQNFLEIRFTSDLEDFAYDKFIEDGGIYFARNLQWSKAMNKDNPKISICYVEVETIFTRDNAKDRIEMFKHSIDAEYFKKCLEILYELEPMVKPLEMWECKNSFKDNPELVKKHGYTCRYLGKVDVPRRFRFR